MNIRNRTLIRGDNLESMRSFPDASIDLIATDPPFNSKRDYFVPYTDEKGNQPNVLMKAFEDTWSWGTEAELVYQELLVDVGGQVGETIEGLRKFLNETPMMAYLVMMAIRIVEMHRLLKNTGALYLHCDTYASHYLKIVLDAIFGVKNFRNEIIWHYRRWTAASKRFQKMHDILLYYTKTNNYTFTKPLQAYADEKYIENTVRGVVDGKLVRLKDDEGNYIARDKQKEGVLMHDVWHDINFIPPGANERTSYPTQKPIELYKRIIEASSHTGNVVLDPFAGCGTTAIAAEQLERQWIGIDLTYLAIGAVKLQIEKFCPQIRDEIIVIGTPEDSNQALELARADHNGFEAWSISHVLKFKSNAKKGSDGGIDGRMKFPVGRIKGKQTFGNAVAQVKGGGYTLGDVRDFRTAMRNVNADLGVFVVTKSPTPKMETEAARAGFYQHPFNFEQYPVLQFYQIQDYFDEKMPNLPPREKIVL